MSRTTLWSRRKRSSKQGVHATPTQLVETMRLGAPGRTRTCDLLLRRLAHQRYLVDLAARLATQKHAKARSERSSCTDLVLESLDLSPFLRQTVKTQNSANG